jgi:hypothetical protein
MWRTSGASTWQSPGALGCATRGAELRPTKQLLETSWISYSSLPRMEEVWYTVHTNMGTFETRCTSVVPPPFNGPWISCPSERSLADCQLFVRRVVSCSAYEWIICRQDTTARITGTTPFDVWRCNEELITALHSYTRAWASYVTCWREQAQLNLGADLQNPSWSKK